MTDTHIAKLMWDAYAIQAGGKTFDGKPLPTWDELGEDRQSCWVAAASVASDVRHHIEKLRVALHLYRCGCTAICENYHIDAGCGYSAREALEGKDD